MIEREVVILNRVGLHTKPASIFAQKASEFQSEITLYHNEICADGKSVISLIALGARQGSMIRLCANGKDEKQAISILSALIDNHFRMGD